MKHIALGSFFLVLFFCQSNGMDPVLKQDPCKRHQKPINNQKPRNEALFGMHLLLEPDSLESHQKLRNQIFFANRCTDVNELEEKPFKPFIETLLTDGSINFDFPYGELKRTQLSIAARSQQFLNFNEPTYKSNLIRWLIQHGANPHVYDMTGRDAILWSIGSYQGENQHPIALFFTVPSFNINQVYKVKDIGDELQTYEPKVTLLTAAILNTWQSYDYLPARYALVRLLLQHKANRNIAPNGRTPLEIAKDLNDQEMIKILETESLS